ncbi:hypothetical protein CK203_077523 [Vitis vinifera]|uniref:Uncharacterized protein n=1 Tax=Vitis vinifera TaxID=29760 RepID=A0A438DTB3_VITVI|nr:hypothetical protein CK203_077523 [Vitis vinifera]
MQEMIICSQEKHLVREAVIGRFEPHLYPMDIPYGNVNEVKCSVLCLLTGSYKEPLDTLRAKVVLFLVAHKKEVPDYDLRTFNFLTLDVPPQPNE